MFSLDDDSFDVEDEDFLNAALAFDSQKPVQGKSAAKRKSFTLSDVEIEHVVSKKAKPTEKETIWNNDQLCSVNQLSEIRAVTSSRKTSGIYDSEKTGCQGDFNASDTDRLSTAHCDFDQNISNGGRGHVPKSCNVLTSKVRNNSHDSEAKCEKEKSDVCGGDYDEIPDDVFATLAGSFAEMEDDTGKSSKLCVSKTEEVGAESKAPKKSSFSFKKKTSPPQSNKSGDQSETFKLCSDVFTPTKDNSKNHVPFQVTSTPLPAEAQTTSTQVGHKIPVCGDSVFKSRILAKLSCFKRDEDSVRESLHNPELAHTFSTNIDKENERSITGISRSDSNNSSKSVEAVSVSAKINCNVSPISKRINIGECQTRSTDKVSQQPAAIKQLRNAPPSLHSGTNFNSVSAKKAVVESENIGSLQTNKTSVDAGPFKAPPVPATESKHSAPVISNQTISNRQSVSFSLQTPHSSNQLRNAMRDVSSVSNKNSVNVSTPVSNPFPSDLSHSSRHTEWDTPSTSESSFRSGEGRVRGKRKRKFPGPAGVLPKLKSGQGLAELGAIKPAASPRVTPHQQKVLEIPCSQSTEDKFQEEQWLRMKEELEPRAAEILKQFDVASVLRKASKKQLPRGKVPVICVMLDQVNTHNADASVVIRDPSGEMKGTIHRQLVKEYQVELQSGCVLVLRQCGVFSPSAKNHYLNITPNNLVRIYSKSGDAETSIKINDFVADDFVVPEPVQSKPAWASSETGQSQVPSDLRAVGLSHNSGMPFSVIGAQRQQPPVHCYRTPGVKNTKPTSFHQQTPQVRQCSSPNTRQFTGYTNGGLRSVNSGGIQRQSTPCRPQSAMNISARNFTPNSGRSFTPNTARTFTRPTSFARPPLNSNINVANSKQTDVEPAGALSNVKADKKHPALSGDFESKNNEKTAFNGTSYTVQDMGLRNTNSSNAHLPTRPPLVQKNAATPVRAAKFQFKKQIGTPSAQMSSDASVEKKDGTHAKTTTTALEFSIQEDMDDLLKGIDEEMFGDM